MFITKAAYDKVSTPCQLNPIRYRKTFPRNGQCSLTLTMQTPLPRQVTCCIFCAQNVSKLLTSCRYQEISSYLYDALITSVMHKHILETELRVYCHHSAWDLRALFTFQSDLKGSLYSPAHCDGNRTQLIYCTLGQGIKFLNEKLREVHMPLSTPIVLHSSTTVCFKTLPLLDRNNPSFSEISARAGPLKWLKWHSGPAPFGKRLGTHLPGCTASAGAVMPPRENSLSLIRN